MTASSVVRSLLHPCAKNNRFAYGNAVIRETMRGQYHLAFFFELGSLGRINFGRRVCYKESFRFLQLGFGVIQEPTIAVVAFLVRHASARINIQTDRVWFMGLPFPIANTIFALASCVCVGSCAVLLDLSVLYS